MRRTEGASFIDNIGQAEFWNERVAPALHSVWQAGYYAAVADAANGTTTPHPSTVSWQWPAHGRDLPAVRAANGERLPACDPRREAWCWLGKGVLRRVL